MAKKAAKKTASSTTSSTIDPGQSKDFLYVGNLIPNQVKVSNLGAAAAGFRLTSVPGGWVYYGTVPGHGAVTLRVKFPNGRQNVFNAGRSPIEYTGNGIRPTS